MVRENEEKIIDELFGLIAPGIEKARKDRK